MKRTNMERFWAMVDKTETCWNWTGAKCGGRKAVYGTFKSSRPRMNWYTHRWSYMHHNGEVPVGMHVMHSCDNPTCVNPEHLRLGTAADNAEDKRRKGRAPRIGAKLTVMQVQGIKSALAGGEIHRTIAARYGVSRPAVSLIHSGKTWSTV